ncbi:MAG TPA: hypothetical protein VEC06_17350 [Paucimonas sp.]|nr:hypothetical protein [Paucimonas sp.]
MRLLLTTSHSLLLLDTDSGKIETLDRGRGLYYGLAQHGDRLYVAARNRLVSSDIAQADERGEILIFDTALRPCGSLRAPFPLRDLHEIAWYDRKLWATASFDNMIAIFDGERWERWYPLGAGTEEPTDVNHFNSFMFDDDKVWIMAHNHGDSELLAFALKTRELVQRVGLGKCAHNIWRENGEIRICSSLEGKLLGLDGFALETGGFPRGVAFDGNTRCVGISEYAERAARDLTTGKVMVYDRAWTLQKEIPLPGEGLILDLRPLPEGFGQGAQSKDRPETVWSKLARIFF